MDKWLQDLPKDTPKTLRRLKPAPKRTRTSERVGQATEQAVNRFITETTEKGYVKKSPKYNVNWNRISWNLKNGKPCMYGDKFINPVKLDISNLRRAK